MRNITVVRSLPWTLILALMVLSAAPTAGGLPQAVAAPTNLISNGSFERPVVPSGGYVSYFSGDTTSIPNWAVIGPPFTEVAIVSGSFTQSGFSFPAQDGM